MRKIIFILDLLMLLAGARAQDCTILSKANNITPDRLCSPVTARWEVSYRGVNNGGTPVGIKYDWGNGVIRTVAAAEISPGVFRATDVNIYTSRGNLCNYQPRASLIVNGIECTSSIQEQIVTVWDDDDHNGGDMRISPAVFPVCLGSRADARFQDLTQFNCVPPQEKDNPNVNTRWVQWIYGTDITMTGLPVRINGTLRGFPFRGPVITLTGPVTGSGVWSEIMNVENDKLLGQYFQVTLRNWNYCNPYDDPNIPGGPADPVNGDHPPVETTAIILIVPYPDATITPVDSLCASSSPVTLDAHDPGGTWSGRGVTGNIFDPSVAGPGDHIITYRITSPNGCSASDQETITVLPVPDASIMSVPLICIPHPAITLNANDPGGIWSGAGVSGNMFDPSVSGPGNHSITYTITDNNGCQDSDTITIRVERPDATISKVDTLCINGPAVLLSAHDSGGIWSGSGVLDEVFDPSVAGAGTHKITYNLSNTGCNASDFTYVTVMPVPDVLFSSPGTIFIESPPIKLTAVPSKGTYSGAGVTGDLFNPADAGTGTHVIKFRTIPDRYGCYAEDTIHINVILPPPPAADFIPDTAGCAPLKISFQNRSLYGETFAWDFGDKTFSGEENPEHIFTRPGNYIVRLTVTNTSGTDYHLAEINVYQEPSAAFTVFPTEIMNSRDIVKFTNNSYYADTYLWKFGDGETSTEFEPWHKYLRSDTYFITLIATSREGCVDSFTNETPLRINFRDGSIQFANAFRWNQSGPTGGYWEEGVKDNTVFRPFLKNVVEFKMIIYTKWGNQIYESNYLYKGWDGYFGDGTLAQQGVYVYKVTGRYADGSSFLLVGDVTFLH